MMRKKIKKVLPIEIILIFLFAITAFAVPEEEGIKDMWTVANELIVDIYNKIAGLSTVLAGLMTAVCALGMKLSNTQQKSDQQLDWMKKIWTAWAIINGIGAFLAYIVPIFNGLNTIESFGITGE